MQEFCPTKFGHITRFADPDNFAPDPDLEKSENLILVGILLFKDPDPANFPSVRVAEKSWILWIRIRITAFHGSGSNPGNSQLVKRDKSFMKIRNYINIFD